MNKSTKAIGISAVSTYGLLKLPMSKVDPYTRASIGGIVGFCVAVIGAINKNHLIGWSGIGIAIGGALTLDETQYFGAKIVSNKYGGSVYVLHETEGVKELQPYELPDFRIDGLAIQGIDGVFKAHDGVYLEILADGTILPTFGLGGLVNKIGAGYMSKSWAEAHGQRWQALVQKSI